MRTSKNIQHSLLMLDRSQRCLPEFAERSSNAGRSAIVDALSAATGPDQRRLVIAATIGTIGFDSVCYWRFARTGDLMTRALYVREFSAPEWPDLYIRERYIEIDPRIAFAFQCEWPFIWDLGTLAQNPTGTQTSIDLVRLHSLVDDCDRAAQRSGVTLALSNPRSSFQSVITFSAANASRHWITDRVVGQAYAVGLALHEFVLTHAPSLEENVPAKPITQTQRRILGALTQGLSDKEIADLLGTSAYNVDYHLRQLKRRYGAQNRVHLAYLAGCRDDWRRDGSGQRTVVRAAAAAASNAAQTSTVA